ncbi:ABC transporter ATP-binding protein [Haloarcula marina]|uniref:ABC transporter ATP-binding protein n=1 Tax=Haloarcula marina TaxID=2961574 RepID=UPI002113C466|nr:ABC transporter ATP-binding protein [Halomicroarcula marina]
MVPKAQTNDQPPTVSDPVLEMKDASVTFDMDRGVSKVLDSVSIDIERNEVFGVVGESGSGKSMFASALLDAVVDPGQLSGSITYHPDSDESVDVLELSDSELKKIRWEEISMVFQGAMSSFNPTMKIKGHFLETLKTHDYDVEEGMERARELLENLYLEPDRVLGSYAHELSGGMQQRTLIALSLVLEPEVLVMDEPTAALDLLMQRSIISLLEKLKEEYDLTLVFITHDLPLVTELCNRVGVLYAFEFVEVATTEEILEGPGHPYARALLNATPNLDAPLEEMSPIVGSSPDPVDAPSGCSYAHRCPLATDQCRAEDPPYYRMSDTHSAACHHWDAAQEEIPLSHHEEDVIDVNDEMKEANSNERVKRTNDRNTVVSLDDISIHFENNSGIFDRFRETDPVRAVENVDLEIQENDVVALVGESGCGKTTLGKATIGVQQPTGGTVSYRGQDIWAARDGRGDIDIPFRTIRRRLQMIHQDPGSSLNPNRRVRNTLAVPLKKWHHDLTKEDRQARILGMLEEVGMTPPEDYADRYPHQLSGGEKQRVALIRALLMNPDLILADEAISALDVSLRVEMMDLFLDLQDRFGTSFVFISHDLANARYLTEKADGRIAVMYLGRIVEIGTSEEIVQNPQHPYTKALRWATPGLKSNEDAESPLRTIDIPDPVDPPNGCSFHTRCPEAREVCRKESPTLCDIDDDTHRNACFRSIEDHEYWESEPLVDVEADVETEDSPVGTAQTD